MTLSELSKRLAQELEDLPDHECGDRCIRLSGSRHLLPKTMRDVAVLGTQRRTPTNDAELTLLKQGTLTADIIMPSGTRRIWIDTDNDACGV